MFLFFVILLISSAAGVDDIHISVVVCNRSEEALVMVKSAILFTLHPAIADTSTPPPLLHFHILADDQSRDEMQSSLHDLHEMFTSFGVPRDRLIVTFYPVSIPTMDWRLLEGNKPCAGQKLIVPYLIDHFRQKQGLPLVESVINVDSDVVFLSSLSYLQSHFSLFNSTHWMSLAAEHEIPQIAWYGRFSRAPFYGRYGLNSGIWLLNMTRIRHFALSDAISSHESDSSHSSPRSIYELFSALRKQYGYDLIWGDQDVLNVFAHDHPERISLLPCSWNYRPDHCQYGQNCPDLPPASASFPSSSTNDAAVDLTVPFYPALLHGNRQVFHRNTSLSFRHVYRFIRDLFNQTVSFTVMETSHPASTPLHVCSKLSQKQQRNLLESARAVAPHLSRYAHDCGSILSQSVWPHLQQLVSAWLQLCSSSSQSAASITEQGLSEASSFLASSLSPSTPLSTVSTPGTPPVLPEKLSHPIPEQKSKTLSEKRKKKIDWILDADDVAMDAIEAALLKEVLLRTAKQRQLRNLRHQQQHQHNHNSATSSSSSRSLSQVPSTLHRHDSQITHIPVVSTSSSSSSSSSSASSSTSSSSSSHPLLSFSDQVMHILLIFTNYQPSRLHQFESVLHDIFQQSAPNIYGPIHFHIVHDDSSRRFILSSMHQYLVRYASSSVPSVLLQITLYDIKRAEERLSPFKPLLDTFEQYFVAKGGHLRGTIYFLAPLIHEVFRPDLPSVGEDLVLPEFKKETTDDRQSIASSTSSSSLPTRIMKLDIDIKINANLRFLWKHFDGPSLLLSFSSDFLFTADAIEHSFVAQAKTFDQNNNTALALAFDMQPVYRHILWKYRREHPHTHIGSPPPDGFAGFNSGVLLLDLTRMRMPLYQSTFMNISYVHEVCKQWEFKGHLGDQDWLTLLGIMHPELFYRLPCQWNRQLCSFWKVGYADVFDQYNSCSAPIFIWHGNCNTPFPSEAFVAHENDTVNDSPDPDGQRSEMMRQQALKSSRGHVV